MREGIELIKALSLAFGPTGCEGAVCALIKEEIQDLPVELYTDRMGNLTAHVKGPEGALRVLLAAHMDEVGFMITEIEKKGFLRFDTVGGIDPRVMVGRAVVVGDEQKRQNGVIAAKGIHFQSADERAKMPEVKDMYIDIGVADKESAEALVSLGDFGTFDTPFLTFGEKGEYLSGKALDDRLGCAVLIELLRRVVDRHLPLDLWFAFTVREEIGLSGATVVANRISPDIAFILETTAMADLPDVPAARRVADMGEGGVLSLLDKGTIYDRSLVDKALEIGKRHAIPVQVKRFVSGGNDAKNVQRTGIGVRCMALSAPTRYLHAPVTVAKKSDADAMIALLDAMLCEL
ncbi:MAG: M42 family metallopeptidase [Clostridia bacterium]|nr:M42 family metallopeptidase [Clostridia bacterium]